MPIFLWLLPLAAIPMLIHIFNNMSTVTVNYSTLQFFKIIENKSIKRLKLIQIILLIIRTIIILLIIMMIARPLINRNLSANPYNPSSLHAIIIDDSYSLFSYKNQIKYSIEEVLHQIPKNNP